MPTTDLPLKDVHLPPPISMWPLAWGWYILIFVVVLSVIWLVVWMVRRKRRNRDLQAALQELREVHRVYLQNTNAHWALAQISNVLRRLALMRYPRHFVAGLAGKRWLEFLDKTGQTQGFTQGPGQILQDAPFRAQIENQDMEAVFKLVLRWIHRQHRPLQVENLRKN